MPSPNIISRILILLISATSITCTVARSDVMQRSVSSPSPITSRAAPEPDYFTENVIGCTNGSGGAFSFLWGNVENVPHPVCGKGWSKGTNRTITYQGTYFPNGESKFFIYGLTQNPLVEYFIMESFGVYKQSSDTQIVGKVTCNGADYDTLQGPRLSDGGVGRQYWSARTGIVRGPISGSVDTDCHFRAWEKLGLNLGTHEYQIAAVDGYFSSGSAKLTVSSQ